MNRKLGFALLGLWFGFALARSGASQYDYIHRMFAGQDLHIAYLMGTAIVLAAIGMRILKAAGNKTIDGKPITVKVKPMSWSVVTGGIIFGIGWGISGYCPATAMGRTFCIGVMSFAP